MNLYIMRHGPAEDRSASGRDEDRELTPNGRQRTRAVAQAFLDAGERPLRLLSSPLVRAHQTADVLAHVAEARGAASAMRVELRSEMAPGGAALALIHELQRGGSDGAMLVGHEPDLSMLVTSLTGHELELGMLKAMIVGVVLHNTPHAPTARGVLRFVLDPTTLACTRT